MQVVRFNVAMEMVVCGSAEEPVFDQVRSAGQRALTSEVVEASQATLDAKTAVDAVGLLSDNLQAEMGDEMIWISKTLWWPSLRWTTVRQLLARQRDEGVTHWWQTQRI